MKASFWKALETLGAAGSARCDWQRCLGEDWQETAPLLQSSGRTASVVIDPHHPPRRLVLVPDGAVDFVALDDDDPGRPPVTFAAADVQELTSHWGRIGRELAGRIGFDAGEWERSGSLRRIGSSQDPFGRVSPVCLFLPPGQLGDYPALVRQLDQRIESTILLPSPRWFTPEIEAIRARNRLEFVDLQRRLAPAEGESSCQAPLPAIVRAAASPERQVRAVLHAGRGLAWEQVRIVLMGNRTIQLRAPGQQGRHTFARRSKLSKEHPLGILMTLAAKGEWRNPHSSAPDYERVSRAFQRLQTLLRQLVPLPTKPFRRSDGAYVPLFQVEIAADFLER